jgi:hypothetical protein
MIACCQKITAAPVKGTFLLIESKEFESGLLFLLRVDRCIYGDATRNQTRVYRFESGASCLARRIPYTGLKFAISSVRQTIALFVAYLASFRGT